MERETDSMATYAKKKRRRFEDEMRKAFNLLISRGLHDEAEDLIFRLQERMVKAMAQYLD